MLVLVFKVVKIFPKISKKVAVGGDFLIGINEIYLGMYLLRILFNLFLFSTGKVSSIRFQTLWSSVDDVILKAIARSISRD